MFAVWHTQHQNPARKTFQHEDFGSGDNKKKRFLHSTFVTSALKNNNKITLNPGINTSISLVLQPSVLLEYIFFKGANVLLKVHPARDRLNRGFPGCDRTP